MSLLHKVAFFPEHIITGFRKAGLYPLNREVIISHEKIKHSTLFSTTTPKRPNFTVSPLQLSVENIMNNTSTPNNRMRSRLTGSNNDKENLTNLAQSLGDSVIETLRQNSVPKTIRKTLIPRSNPN